jgi:hypothetical protein
MILFTNLFGEEDSLSQEAKKHQTQRTTFQLNSLGNIYQQVRTEAWSVLIGSQGCFNRLLDSIILFQSTLQERVHRRKLEPFCCFADKMCDDF